MRKRALGVLLLVALLPLGACGGDDESEPKESTPTTAGGLRVDIENFAFAPDRVSVPVGGTMTWRNGDNTAHTITADDGSFDSGGKGSGQSFEHTFTTAGEVKYHCTIHPSMTGTVVVSG